MALLITFMETENQFLKISGWTTESRFTAGAVGDWKRLPSVCEGEGTVS